MPSAQPTATPGPKPDTRGTTTSPSREIATIGRSITIKGEVSGDEDLLIQGRVDGSVDLKLQSVTVGREGKVKADITGRVVTIEGEVEGDLRADEQIILRASAQVKGDITAPRVVLEDGASFRGLVDMGDPSARDKPAVAAGTSKGAAPMGNGGAKSDDAKKDSGTSAVTPVKSATDKPKEVAAGKGA